MKAPKVATPRSRENKKQISAFLDPALVDTAHKFAKTKELTQTELLAMAINTAVASYGKHKPFLKVERERFIKRAKSVAKVQEKAVGVRKDTTRIAGFFDIPDVEEVKSFSKEVGVRIEGLVRMGLEKVLGVQKTAADNPDEWDWSAIETEKLPKLKNGRKRTAVAA